MVIFVRKSSRREFTQTKELSEVGTASRHWTSAKILDLEKFTTSIRREKSFISFFFFGGIRNVKFNKFHWKKNIFHNNLTAFISLCISLLKKLLKLTYNIGHK